MGPQKKAPVRFVKEQGARTGRRGGGRKGWDWEKGWGCGERREACRGSFVGGSEVGGAKEGAKGRELGP